MSLNELALDIHENAKNKGFWTNNNIAEKLMLIVTEVAEACEADRKNRHANYDNQHIKQDWEKIFEVDIKDTFEDELADAIIRILDLSAKLNIDIDYHVKAKMRYNTTRPYKHGKEY